MSYIHGDGLHDVIITGEYKQCLTFLGWQWLFFFFGNWLINKRKPSGTIQNTRGIPQDIKWSSTDKGAKEPSLREGGQNPNAPKPKPCRNNAPKIKRGGQGIPPTTQHLEDRAQDVQIRHNPKKIETQYTTRGIPQANKVAKLGW